MVRPFVPTGPLLPKTRYYEWIESRLSHSGEYVYHVPLAGPRQAVVMNFQHIPDKGEGGIGFQTGQTVPQLWGLAVHFENVPTTYRPADSVRTPSGSQFEVRGFLYNAKYVEINHRDYMRVDLVRADKCAEPRPEFFDEMEILCSNVTPCGGT